DGIDGPEDGQIGLYQVGFEGDKNVMFEA
ncbi:MAG: hypothetical protein RIR09_196, partial [Pseudomonadota bacterium]